MSGEPATADQDENPRSGVRRWALVAIVLFLVAWFQNAMAAIVVSHQTREINFPAATHLALNVAGFLYLVGGVALLFGVLSWRTGILRRPIGPMILVMAGFVLHLLFAYFLTLPMIVLAAGGAPRRLPDPSLEILMNADRIELYTVNSDTSGNQSNRFQGFPILARTNLSGAEARSIGDAFVESFSTNSSNVMLCFDPGYAMRAFHGEENVDLVLCYECKRVLVVHKGKQSEIALPPDTLPMIAQHFPNP